jgi:hypothetical protein
MSEEPQSKEEKKEEVKKILRDFLKKLEHQIKDVKEGLRDN